MFKSVWQMPTERGLMRHPLVVADGDLGGHRHLHRANAIGGMAHSSHDDRPRFLNSLWPYTTPPRCTSASGDVASQATTAPMVAGSPPG